MFLKMVIPQGKLKLLDYEDLEGCLSDSIFAQIYFEKRLFIIREIDF